MLLFCYLPEVAFKNRISVLLVLLVNLQWNCMCGLVVASDVLYCVSATLARTKVVSFAWRSASSIVPFAALLRPVMLQFIGFACESRLGGSLSTVLAAVSYPRALLDMARSFSIRDAFVFWVLAILCRVSIADLLVPHQAGWHCDAHLGSCLEISPKDSFLF